MKLNLEMNVVKPRVLCCKDNLFLKLFSIINKNGMPNNILQCIQHIRNYQSPPISYDTKTENDVFSM